jgi:hypothetical protein
LGEIRRPNIRKVLRGVLLECRFLLVVRLAGDEVLLVEQLQGGVGARFVI